MYNKAVILDIKKEYAIVVTDDGLIIKIKIKDGITVGQQVFIFEDDILDDKKDVSSRVRVKRMFTRKSMYIAAASIMFVIIVAVSIFKTKTVNAGSLVYIEGSYGVELEVDKDDQVVGIEYKQKNDEKTDNSKKWIGKKIDDVLPDVFEDVDKTHNGEKPDIKYSVKGDKKKKYEDKLKESLDDYKEKKPVQERRQQEKSQQEKRQEPQKKE